MPGPFGWQIDEASYPHAVRKPPLYGGSDQIRGEERERDSHVHLSGAAALSFCDAFAGCCWIPDEFIEPTTSGLILVVHVGQCLAAPVALSTTDHTADEKWRVGSSRPLKGYQGRTSGTN